MTLREPPEGPPSPPSLGEILGGGTVLITGGAGFIGSTLALAITRAVPDARVVAFDNLRRAGSELNVPKLARAGVRFVHGDIRIPQDLEPVRDRLRLVIDCAADPSVLAGYSTAPAAVTGSNLIGTMHCLELARRAGADVVFLSTSRVYPIAALNRIAVVERETRFEIDGEQTASGVSPAGISESFPLEGTRSLYGATKLASELLLQEYGEMYGLRYVINRLGVVTGRGQMGKVEQGVFALWMARHYFGGELTYRGWKGTGKQVRDLLHVQDVWSLVQRQLICWQVVNGRTYNVGGGPANSVSLLEATSVCGEITGRRIPVRCDAATHPSDIRLYSTDYARVAADTGWHPGWSVRAIFTDLFDWFRSEDAVLRPFFCS